MTKPQDFIYRVNFIVVDRPERRNASFKPVRAGQITWTSRTAASYRGAINLFEGLLAGEDDFESEYVREVEVVRVYSDGRRSTVRSLVVREELHAQRWGGELCKQAERWAVA